MKYICGIDIGSSKIAACLAYFRGKELVHLWWDSTAALGIKQGQWQDIGGLTDALSQLLKKLKAKSGVKIKSVYLDITSKNIAAKHSQAVIALTERGNKSVTKTDIHKVNQQAQILGSCLEDEILYTEPLSYTIDSENEVVNPLGLYGHQLKIDLYLICVRVAYINTIIEVINRLGLKLNDITFSGLAASQAMFNLHRLGGLNVVCDIGKDVIQILIFNDGRLRHYQIIAAGGDDLTVSLSRGLDLPYSLAEEVKISHGSIQSNYKSTDKEIIIKKGNTHSTISQNLVIQILSQSSRQIAQRIRDVIRPHLLAISSPLNSAKAAFYVAGRTAALDGFLELLEVVLEMPVKMAKIGNSSLLTPLMHQRILWGDSVLNYLACFGLIAKLNKPSYRRSVSKQGLGNILSYIPEKVKEIYQEYF